MKNLGTTIIMLVILSCNTSFGAGKNKTKNKTILVSLEQRQSMASNHDKMASCLRSDKSVEICHNEMMKSCQEMMGKNSCSGMEEMHGTMKDVNGEKNMMHDSESEINNSEKK
jgi:hypothetical protein